MKNVDAFLKTWMNGDLLKPLCDFLRGTDPEFSLLEDAYLRSPEAEPLLRLRQQQINADLLFVFWQGLNLNLENFRNPVGNLLLGQDFSQLVREHILFSMSAHCAAQQALDALAHSTGTPTQDTTQEFYIYLETVGLKIMHYLGFRLGDLLYPFTEPGYVPDVAATQTYRAELEEYLGFPLKE
jgi:hypothetical protein